MKFSKNTQPVTVAFYINGLEESKKFLKGLKMFTVTDIAGHVGVLHKYHTLCRTSYMTDGQKISLNITANLIRISIGLEHICM
ncbi:hypothetical protein NQ318_016927 [Aromia moschata]|uniref:Uncharacterized protein n=1 Tax=Aromia moschata TaxID=1265417 RepID=A0AAV8X655_9CUCU|nr:hypothetical protein NQ318_016927 [Aromia moschata]